MLRKISLSALCLFAPLLLASPKKGKMPEMSLVEWAKEQSLKVPAEVDGVRIFRPDSTDADGKVLSMGMLALKGVNQEQAFTSALIAAFDEIDSETDIIEAVDFDKMRFVVWREISEGEYKDARTYRFATAFQFDNELMMFSCYDVNIEYKEKGLIPRKLDLEKFKPATNERHCNLVEGFALCSSRQIDVFKNAALTRKSMKITHWSEIKAGKVVKGMNEDEVRLIGGSPRSINKSGERTQWMFSNDFVVIFENGIVCNVVQ